MIWASALLFSIGMIGCKSKFEKLRAGNDNVAKYREAINLYNNKKYSKALILFEDLSNKYRGRPENEELMYYHAYTSYRLRDYTSARFHFKNFTDQYPQSQRAEECRFMGAYCYYLESPVYTLDQENTLKAIESLQLFINLYPKSDRAEEAAKFIQDLRDKLEHKSYANAKLYLDVGDYKAAVIAFQNSLRDYPDTKYAEEMEYLAIRAQYLYAKNSMLTSQEGRYQEAIEYSDHFIDNYPESKFKKDAEGLKKNSQRDIESVKKLIATLTPTQKKKEKEKEEELNNSPRGSLPQQTVQ
ncbi:outer membrane protein assembly factor BamD [Olivibacter sp. XZL3]|uniref:outer membrane protein assembly factor BamD n=1 Tax=Olivibacter sp. XZL3 TaxID=1735116 RepID=UPI001064BB9C|nr:outer membrane protein assembly factor BamD [Olivibacter sp. XZL3]